MFVSSPENWRICLPQPKVYPQNSRFESVLSRSGRPYEVVALGGTFDVLHAGHKQLLSEAFRLGDKVLIGVTSDRLVRASKKNHPVRPFKERVRDVRLFLRTRNWASRARISELNEPYGPAYRRKKLQALIVSKGTLESGRLLNKLREARGLRPLHLRVVRLRMSEDGRPISSTRIRDGEIDLRGRLLKTRG